MTGTKRYLLLLGALLLLMGAGFGTQVPLTSSPAVPTVPPLAPHMPGELLVALTPGSTLQAPASNTQPASGSLAAVLVDYGVQQVQPLAGVPRTYQVRFDPTRAVQSVLAAVRAHPTVAYAEPNYVRHLMETPDDPFVREQWALTTIEAFAAWDTTTGGAVVVAVLDTGVLTKHPDLNDKLLPGYNAINGSSSANDDNGHGTAVSGLIAAETDNGRGIAGMCWECKILPVKVLNARGSGSDAAVARGIRWATDAGARIINLSLGGSGDSRVLHEAVRYAHERGVFVVSASGNERQSGNPVNYPAAYPEVMAVGGTGNNDQITGFSNTGDHLDISAPAVGLWTTIPGDREYGPPNGTSFSSPYVAGTAALLATLRPDLFATDLKCILEMSADDVGAPGKDPEHGWGRLNARRAVEAARQYTECPLGTTVLPAPSFPAESQAFKPVPPQPSTAELTYFPETMHTVRGAFKTYWEMQGGLEIFGFPISEEFYEAGDDGGEYLVQYFERYRFELHPQNPPPYHVQLSRLGPLVLELQGRNWRSFPRGTPSAGCVFFEDTGQTLCEPFLSHWRSNGLEFDGIRGTSREESTALFGHPISPQRVEEVSPGVYVTVQWFERARFEYHGDRGVLLGLLSSDLARLRGWQ